MAQYFSLYSWFIWPTVQRSEARRNAVMAIGVVETIEDKVNAVKTGIVAAFFEFGAGTEDFQRVTK